MNDIHTWLQAILDGKLLSEESLEIYFTNGAFTKPYRPGRYDDMDIDLTRSVYFGWEWYSNSGQRVLERGGASNGFFALVRYIPGLDTTIIILSNFYYFDDDGNFIRGLIVQALASALREN